MNLAAGQGYGPVVELLAALAGGDGSGASFVVNAIDGDGNGVLHLALGREGVLRDAHPDLTNERSPKMLELMARAQASELNPLLIHAVTIGCFLIDHGADPNLRNKEGLAPFDFVYDYQARELLSAHAAARALHSNQLIRVSSYWRRLSY